MKKNLTQFSIANTICLLVLLFITSFTTRFFSEDDLFKVLFSNRFWTLPLFFYLIVFAFTITFFTGLFVKLYELRKLKRIERSIKNLLQGYYTSKIFDKMTSKDEKVQISKRVDQLFIDLKNKQIQMSKEALISNEEHLKLSTETKEEILEHERHRIARELHDSVSQQLFASSMMLSALNSQSSGMAENLKKQLETVESIINESQSEMRALLLHLRPIKLNDKTLKQGVVQLLKELSTKVQMNIKYDIQTLSVPVSIEDNLFRITQELLSNVLRHAKAKELEVYLKQVDNRVHLRVIDDGVGFDMNEKRTGNYGLANIKERISGLGGNVKIVSFKNQGTTVEIIIPISIGGEQ